MRLPMDPGSVQRARLRHARRGPKGPSVVTIEFGEDGSVLGEPGSLDLLAWTGARPMEPAVGRRASPVPRKAHPRPIVRYRRGLESSEPVDVDADGPLGGASAAEANDDEAGI